MFVYMCCTADKYQLPLAVADSPLELSQIVGVSNQRIMELICHQRKRDANPKPKKRNKMSTRLFYRVEIPDGEDEDDY